MDRETRLNALFLRWQERRDAGEPASPAELCADCPELREDLEQRLRALDDMARFLGAGSVAAGLPETATDVRTGEPGLRESGDDYSFLTPPRADDEMGRLGGYRILGVLGAGGMGVVFRAEEQQPRRLVALKVMKPELAANDRARRRFLDEGQSAASVEHPRVVPIFRVDQANGVPFLVMPLLKGTSLEDLLRERKRLPAAQAVRVAREMAEGLAAAHAAGLIHRDVKPGNVWLREGQTGESVGPDPAGWPVVLLDFGVARAASIGQPLTLTGGAVGTPGYMAPEQAAGEEVGPRADMFGLGCVLYRMLTGRHPFSGRDVISVLRSVALEEPTPPHQLQSEIPAALSTLVIRLLAKNPGDRPATALEVVESLRGLEEREGSSPFQGTAPTFAQPAPQAPPPAGRRRGCAVAVTVSCCLLAVAAALALSGGLRDWVWGTLFKGDPPPETSRPEPLRITKFQVDHILVGRKGPDSRARRGAFGDKSFGAWVDDGVQVEVEFSEPAYAYFLVFNPNPDADKREEVFPESARDTRPGPVKRLRFPEEGYLQLSDGPGLQIFAVVASRKPLPAYPDWVKQRGDVGWRQVASPPEVVWQVVDGQPHESFPKDDSRSHVVVAKDLPMVERLFRRLESAPGVEAADLKAITVEPRP